MKKNLITVLKKTLTAFGGEDTTDNNAVDIIDKIADNISGGGGNSQPLVINVSAREVEVEGDNKPNRYLDIDKSYNEILNAVMAGQKILFVCPLPVDDDDEVTIENFKVAEPIIDSSFEFLRAKLEGTIVYIVDLGLPPDLLVTLNVSIDNGIFAISPDAPMSSEWPLANQDDDSQSGDFPSDGPGIGEVNPTPVVGPISS